VPFPSVELRSPSRNGTAASLILIDAKSHRDCRGTKVVPGSRIEKTHSMKAGRLWRSRAARKTASSILAVLLAHSVGLGTLGGAFRLAQHAIAVVFQDFLVPLPHLLGV